MASIFDSMVRVLLVCLTSVGTFVIGLVLAIAFSSEGGFLMIDPIPLAAAILVAVGAGYGVHNLIELGISE